MKRIALLSFATATAFAIAAPPTVSYSVYGSSGNYTLDFSVTNNLGVNGMFLYFFGVELSASNVVGSPSPFDPTIHATWSNVIYGGSPTVYNNNWIVPLAASGIPDGATWSGFQVQVSDAVAPVSVKWFAVAFSSGGLLSYPGGEHFNTPENPGFEGIAAVPEPASLALLGLGAAAVARKRRR